MFRGLCCFEYSRYNSISLSDDNIYFKHVHFFDLFETFFSNIVSMLLINPCQCVLGFF